MVDNAMKGSDSNRLWMQIEPLVDERGQYIKDEYGRDIDEVVELGDNDLFGSLQAKREMLTEEGEFASEDDIKFDPEANIKRGIPYYQRALDALARKFATEFNKANTNPVDPDNPDDPNREQVFVGYETVMDLKGVERYKIKDGVTCDLTNDNVTSYTDPKSGETVDLTDWLDYKDRVDLTGAPEDVQAAIRAMQKEHLSPDGQGHGYPVYGGGILFSVSGDSNDTVDANGIGITASNISISKNWSVGSVRLLARKNENIYHMIGLMEEKMGYSANEIKDIVSDAADGDEHYFEGSFQQRLSDINVILSTAQKISTTNYVG